MLSVIGPGGMPGALLCGGELVSAGIEMGAAGLGTGAGLGCAQAAAKAADDDNAEPSACHICLRADRAAVHFNRILKPRTKLQNRVTFHLMPPSRALTFSGNDGTLFLHRAPVGLSRGRPKHLKREPVRRQPIE